SERDVVVRHPLFKGEGAAGHRRRVVFGRVVQVLAGVVRNQIFAEDALWDDAQIPDLNQRRAERIDQRDGDGLTVDFDPGNVVGAAGDVVLGADDLVDVVLVVGPLATQGRHHREFEVVAGEWRAVAELQAVAQLEGEGFPIRREVPLVRQVRSDLARFGIDRDEGGVNASGDDVRRHVSYSDR